MSSISIRQINMHEPLNKTVANFTISSAVTDLLQQEEIIHYFFFKTKINAFKTCIIFTNDLFLFTVKNYPSLQ